MSILDFSSSNHPAVPTKVAIFGAVLIGAVLIPGRTMAQDPVSPVPLTVMRRAIEAFEDAPFPTGYVVLETAFPHTVHRVGGSADSANAMVQAAIVGELIAAGPLSHDLLAGVIIICEHHRRTSEIECPGGPPLDTTRVTVPLDSVESLELLVQLINGDVERWRFEPGVDAIFLSPTAMAKFAWPYLARYGVGYAAERRREYLDAIQ